MLESLVFSLKLMRKYPVRSIMTILQVALGVWVVTTLISMNVQVTSEVNNMVEQYGTDLAQINLTKDDNQNLVLADFKSLAEESQTIQSAFVYQSYGSSDIQVAKNIYDLYGIVETTTVRPEPLGISISSGTFFTETDIVNQNNVVLISERISNQLFPEGNAVGKIIEVDSAFREGFIPFEVIGVYAEMNQLVSSFLGVEANMLIPSGTRAFAGRSYGDFVSSRVFIEAAPNNIYEAIQEVRLKYPDDDQRTYHFVQYFSDFVNRQRSNIAGMTVFLGIFGFIAVIISSAGILSIMLTSVLERTREIGLRKALGATRLMIIRNILSESLLLSFLGSVVGIVAVNIYSNKLINTLLGSLVFQQEVSNVHPLAMLIGSGLTLLIGLIFGLYPSIQAANLTPVEALQEN